MLALLGTNKIWTFAVSNIDKFVGYFKEEDGKFRQYYNGTVPNPLLDPRQIVWVIATPIIGFFLYRYFYFHQSRARKTVVVLSVILLVSKAGEHVIAVIFGREPIMKIFPYHLCSFTGFAIPLVALFNIKKLKLSIYTLGLMGGVVTMLLGDSFASRFVTVYVLISVLGHTLIILIPLIEHATGEYQFELKKSWTIVPILLLTMIWATAANRIFFKNTDSNYMYLEKSGFPGGFGGQYFFLLYILVFSALYAVLFIPPAIRRRRKLLLALD